MKSIHLILTFTIGLTACSNGKIDDRLMALDSLDQQLKAVADRMAVVDSQLVVSRLNDIQQTEQWIYENITDTMNSKYGIAFGDYLRAKKKMNRMMDGYTRLNKELSYSRNQLKNLREDVRNGQFSDEEFASHLEDETKADAILVETAEHVATNYALTGESYLKAQPKVQAFVDSVKSVIYSDKPIEGKK